MTVFGILKSLTALTLAFLLTACGGGSGSDSSTQSPAVSSNEDSAEQPSPNNESEDPTNNSPEKIISVSWDDSATLMSDSGLSAEDPAVAISESGNVAAIWVEITNPTSLWGRFYDKTTGEWSNPTQLDKGDAGVRAYGILRSNPKVVFAGEVAVAVWEQEGAVYSSVHDENGWSGNPQVVDGTDSTYRAFDVNIAALKDGEGAVVSYEYKDGSEQPVLRSSLFSTTTRVWETPVEVSSEIVQLSNGIQMVTAPMSGAVHIAWRKDSSVEIDSYDLMTASFWNGGWSTPEVVASGNIDSATIQADPHGDRPFIAWTTDEDREVFFARYEVGEWSVSEFPDVNSQTKTIDSTVMADEDILIAYKVGTNWGNIITQRLDVETGTWEKKDITGNEYSVGFPSVAADGNGRAVVAYLHYHTWARNYTEADGWGRTYQPDGLNSGEQQKVVMNQAGDAALIWKTDSGDKNIHVLLGK